MGICIKRLEKDKYVSIGSGVVYFKKSKFTLDLLDKWYERCFNEVFGINDQANLGKLLVDDLSNIFSIPIKRYLVKYDNIIVRNKIKPNRRVVVHYMASRRARFLCLGEKEKYNLVVAMVKKHRDNTFDVSYIE